MPLRRTLGRLEGAETESLASAGTRAVGFIKSLGMHRAWGLIGEASWLPVKSAVWLSVGGCWWGGKRLEGKT